MDLTMINETASMMVHKRITPKEKEIEPNSITFMHTEKFSEPSGHVVLKHAHPNSKYPKFLYESVN